MGLDVAFDRLLTTDAGMEFDSLPNSDRTEFDADEDPEYVAWCQESTPCVRVPGTNFWLADDGYDKHIVVRANKWGRAYAPLTKWLRDNNIPWTEF